MTEPRANTIKPENYWTASGWQQSPCLRVDSGRLLSQSRPDPGSETVNGYVLPGLCNAHSHAFQRAIAGRTEHRSATLDNFWSWRETMYQFAGRIGPDELRAIAAQLYVEMLEAGYTWVCEFHYLHHQPDGQPYADPAAMALALIEAAAETGIGMTLLPVLYQTGGFDARPLSERQRRFGFSVAGLLALCQRLRSLESERLIVGSALHSLRAVSASALAEFLAAESAQQRPLHIHIAEQASEVAECRTVRGQSPVAWLLDHAAVDQRWQLVHATHASTAELLGIVHCGANVVLCPTTEANLGDGVFPLQKYLDAGGSFAIGSDSHISVSPVEELRWLEYGQRLIQQQRNVAASAEQPSVGSRLFEAAWRGGLRAAGKAVTADAPSGQALAADLIVLDHQHPQFAAGDLAQVLDTWLFAGNQNLVRDVMSGGRWCVRDGRHEQREAIAARYRQVMLGLR
jgi:formimidoylglutamate deiminase